MSDDAEHVEFMYNSERGGYVLILTGRRDVVREVVENVPTRGKSPSAIFEGFHHEARRRIGFNVEVWNNAGGN